MERIFNLVCVLVACAAVGLAAMNFTQNPVEARRLAIEESRAEITSHQYNSNSEEYVWPFDEWQSAIDRKMKVWDRLTEPPVRKEAPKPIKKAPDWNELLKGVKVTKFGRAETIKVIYPGNPEGNYIGVGASIGRGVTLRSYDRKTATFEHYWEPTDQTRTHTVDRQ